MNQLEAPALVATTAESTKTLGSAVGTGPPPVPSVVVKRPTHTYDRPELDQDDDDQAQQEQSSRQCSDYSGNQRGLDGSSDDCEPMVRYDGFESLGFGPAGLTCFAMADREDDDVVNVLSPIICKPAGSSDRSATLSPTCVSALGREEVRDEDADVSSWTIQEFQEYLGMLEMLEEVCSNASESEGMCLSADSLNQMERLLTSLLPQGV